MRTVPVVVAGVLADQMEEVTFAENHHVIEQLAPQGTYEPFRVPVLPWRPRRGAHLFDAQMLHSCVEGGAVDSIAVADLTRGRKAVTNAPMTASTSASITPGSRTQVLLSPANRSRGSGTLVSRRLSLRPAKHRAK